MKRYKDALTVHADVVARFKDSEAARDALFSLGNTNLLIGNKAEAERAFRRIIADYPNSEQTVRARQRLTFMGIKGE